MTKHNTFFVTLFLGLLIVFVVMLSLTMFSKQSLRLDEAQSLWQTSHSPVKIVHIVAEDVHVPLYHLLLHFWRFLFGTSVPVARWLSLIFFIALIPATYLLGTLAYDSSVGMFAALLVAISPFFNWYGNEIRMYSLFSLLTVVNQYFYLKIYKGRGRPGHDWFWYELSLICGLFTHYFFALVLLCQLIFFFSYRSSFPKDALKKYLMLVFLIVLTWGPWLYYVLHLGGFTNSSPALIKPTTVDLFNTFSEFLFGFQNDHLNTILVALWPLSFLLVLLSLRNNQKMHPESMYFMLCTFVPIGIVFVVSAFYKPIFVTRYLILTLPSLYLVMSWIFSTYPRRLGRAVKTVCVVIILVFLGIEATSALTPVKENYHAVTDYLETNATARDIIVVSAPFTVYPIEYYYKGPAEIATIPIWNRLASGGVPPYNEAKLPDEIATLKGSHQTLWLVLSYDQGYEEKLRLYFDTHFERIDAKNFSKDLNVYAYKLRYD